MLVYFSYGHHFPKEPNAAKSVQRSSKNTMIDHGCLFVGFLVRKGPPKAQRKKLTLPRELRIDRAIYLIDDDTKTYQYLRRNPEWKTLSSEENEANKKALDRYTRVLRSGKTKTYRRAEHP